MPSRAIASLDLVVFDWDGTLADSTSIIARAIQASAADLGLEVPSFQRASHVIGLGLREALARAVPDLREGQRADFAERYRAHYLAAEEAVRLFDGVVEMIDALRAGGATLAIATGKTRAGLERALATAGLQGCFAAIRCADQAEPKPHPAMLLELMAETTVAPARTVMIGDTTHDLAMAAAAGTRAVAVAYGAHPRSELEARAPERVFDSVEQLRTWLLGR
ncbi:MAG TPA: HAD-IA family hydrolase [Burkholderiaceae bacterium]|nr:HAD-IA family hydrolase [Burkholderiaceae bacterium]